MVAFPLLLLWLWFRPPRSPILPAALYLLASTASGIAFVYVENLSSPPLDAAFVLSLPVAFCFPWSLVVIIRGTFLDVNLGESAILAGAALNAILIYCVAKFARRRADQRRIAVVI